MTALTFRTSVGHLAGFVHRRGDLGGRRAPAVTALEGLRRQQARQGKEQGAYLREVPLSGRWSQGQLELWVSGRADGIDLRTDTAVIEEIKTYRGDLDSLRSLHGSHHDAQVAIYAALYASGQSPDGAVATRLRYLHADTGEAEDVERRWTAVELAHFFAATCEAFALWLVDAARWRRDRDASLAELAFPCGGFRPGQRQLARMVWQAIKDGRPLLAEAPTGTGKTLAVLFGALRRLPDSQAARLIYLTARGPGRRSALDAIAQLQASGARLRTVDLTARDKLCLLPGTPCTGEDCPYARGYFDRRRQGMRELLADVDGSSPAIIDAARTQQVARRHGICPAALQGDAARWADVIIGDMNHGYDPFVRQRSLLEAEDGGAVVLIDEAHNLENRVRDMFSGFLSTTGLRHSAVTLRHSRRSLGHAIDRLAGLIDALEESASKAELEALARALERLLPDLGEWLGQAPGGGLFASVRTLHGELLRWLWAWQQWVQDADAYRLVVSLEDGGGRRAALRCLAPAAAMAREQGRWHGLVLFSATLMPSPLQHTVLGLPASTHQLRLPSPFAPERSRVLLVTDLDLRLAARQRSTPALARLIVDVAEARPGHHLVFVPAFSLLQPLARAVATELERRTLNADLLCQTPRMDDGARGAFLQQLAHPDGRTRIAFAISGGVFGEGIDLPGEQLVGVVVAGLPLPPPEVERNAIRDYHGADGFDIAFRMPAVTRLLQAAGRLIRSDQDVGTLCLVDCRLKQWGYRQLLRPDWVVEEVPAAAVGAQVGAFWKSLSKGPVSTAAQQRNQHAQDQDHLHDRAGHGKLPHAGEALSGGDERGTPEHVPCGSCFSPKGDQLDPDLEPQGALSGTDSAGHPGA
ncbi:MAG: ATP-dependent DNA helicase [Gammaproteobacteria bacterium]|nr:ATP-dependent DNA helicase [Gammaproteobacteria bacterium]